MQLTIEGVKPTKSGKSLGIRASGKDFLAKTDSGLQVGMVIEAETETSDYQGKSYTWIGKYKAVSQGNGATQHNGGGHAWLPFTSNTVAHAISAGLIKEPGDVKTWAAAAKQTFDELTGNPPF